MNSTPQTAPSPGTCSASGRRALKINAWLAVATASYVAVHVWAKRNPDWTPATKVMVNLLPILPGILFAVATWRAFKAMDELQRRIQVEALLIAAMGTVVVMTVINVANAQGLRFENYPYGLELGGAYMSVFLLWCLGSAISNFRYR